MAGYTGSDERAFVLDSTDGIGALAGGRIWPSKVPDDVVLPRVSADGAVKPYGIVRFQTPFASTQGRSVASPEKEQPYIFAFSTISYAGDYDSANQLDGAMRNVLIDAIPSARATRLKCVGGSEFTESDSTSRPTRYATMSFYRASINI